MWTRRQKWVTIRKTYFNLAWNFSCSGRSASRRNAFLLGNDEAGHAIYPELDADGDHVHFEMVPMGGDSTMGMVIK
jgi:hypothetical protein